MVLDDIMRLNGKQTIYQMIQLADRIRERGGEPRSRSGTSTSTSAGWTRTSAPAPPGWPSGAIRADELLVHGARPCSSTCAAAAFTSTWPAGPTNPP